MELRCLTDDAALVHAVKKLNLGVLPVQPPAFCYRRAEKDQHRLSWAAMDGDVVTGAAVADLELERGGVRTVQLRTLAVPARFRRQGIGRELVNKVIQQAKEAEKGEDGAEIIGVKLHVHAGNEEALAFYKALGFIEKARIEDYYRRLEPRTAFVMEFPLH